MKEKGNNMTDKQDFGMKKWHRVHSNCIVGLILSIFLMPVFIGWLLLPLCIYGMIQANKEIKKIEEEINLDSK